MNWAGRPVLVTGAGGFIGSHLVEQLVNAGARVRALVHYNALGMRGWLEEVATGDAVEVVLGDVADSDSLDSAMRDCDVVFHLAALIGIPYSYVAPAQYVRSNVIGTLNVLQAARRSPVARVVHTSTSEVYGTAQYTPMDERHPLAAQSPYAATKTGADQLATAFFRTYGTPVTIVRPFNTYGPRQSTRAIVPTIITQALAGASIGLGNLDTARDLTFVLDTVKGFILAAEADDAVGKTINIGSGREVTIRELAELICSIVGRPCEIEVMAERIRPTGSEVRRLVADSTLARTSLGWRPERTLEEGLKGTIEWFQSRGHVPRVGRYAV
ncbi:MAG: SDR family NAD(P)-dependent oxidoreductase [Candidatus Eisenbacteria bacterium]|uniref:SDR family NAD(P)-dependent oxidoreductase n=1 Tax=Eiseniibacteriota bacterium TaxID=2212470 RepID=A0A538SG68_UNCEI|nr:MAG: SDR family NAD(P)-dependent oxidoreductase [Candidatus Eisenbacteria bacterium]